MDVAGAGEDENLRVTPSGSLSTSIVEFCRILSAHGIAVSVADSLIALRALAEIDISNRKLFQHTLGLSLLKRPEDRVAFVVVFDEFWRLDLPEENKGHDDTTQDSPAEMEDHVNQDADPEQGDIDELLARFDYETFWQEPADQQPNDPNNENASGGEQFDDESTPPAPALDPRTDPNELGKLVRALARHFEAKKSRRMQSHRHGSQLDMRRLMKNSVRFGGMPIELAWRRKKPHRPRLVLFVDVSRSMTSYAKLLLQFTTAVLRHAWQVEVFLFATHIHHLTEKQLQDEDFDLQSVIEQCGGSTRIGANLEVFLEHYSYTLTGNRTVTIMLSDGLDGGEQQTLAQSMERLNNRSQKIVWLNPVLAFQDLEHTEREMAAALPFVDILAPAHNIACLWDLLLLLQDKSTSESYLNASETNTDH